VKHFYTNRSSAKCYRCVAGPAETTNTWHWTERFIVFKQKAVAAKLLPYFVPYRIPRGLYYKYNNYTVNYIITNNSICNK
jgi:hypothetical protein